jgi:hypothetical protein
MTIQNLGVRIDSGEDNPPSHGRPLLTIVGERPDPNVLEAMMRPYLDDPPWRNKQMRIVGYTLGGTYRGWLVHPTLKPSSAIFRCNTVGCFIATASMRFEFPICKQPSCVGSAGGRRQNSHGSGRCGIGPLLDAKS